MFPSRYFSRWYFAARYFPSGEFSLLSDLVIAESQTWVFGSQKTQIFIPGANEQESAVFGVAEVQKATSL